MINLPWYTTKSIALVVVLTALAYQLGKSSSRRHLGGRHRRR